MGRRKWTSLAVALLAASAFAGCSSDPSSDSLEERALQTLERCRAHGGVAAFDDDAVVCRDQTSTDERGRNAVDACRRHGGVSAFDDDIAICRDETFHEAKGG